MQQEKKKPVVRKDEEEEPEQAKVTHRGDAAGDDDESVAIRGRSKDEMIEKVVVMKTRNPDTIHYIEKTMTDKGIYRMDRHPADGLGLGQGPPKSGHGGKFTWEGPMDTAESELHPVPPAIDPRDPNYVDDDDAVLVDEDVENMLVGQVEVAKVARAKEGVSRIEIQAPLQPTILP